MADPEERASGLGRPLQELLESRGDASASVAGILGERPAGELLQPALELLRLVFPVDLVGARVEIEGDAGTTRLAGPLPDEAAAWDLDGALRVVLRLGRPHLIGARQTPAYAAPVGRLAAIGVRRVGGELTALERRGIDLIAAHIR